MLGTALLTFTYFGANGIIELGGEIINPSKVIPRAFLVAFPVVLLIYAAVAFATVGAAPGVILNDAAEPLIQISRLTVGKAGSVFFIICGAIVALTTTLNALFIVGTKSLLVMAQDQLLPASLGSLNKRFGTPHILLAIVWILSILGIVSGFSLDTFASFAALGGLIIFLPVQIASLRLPHLFPGHYRRSPFKLRGFWRWFCPAVGVFMVLFFGLLILFDLKSALKIGWFLAFIASGLIYYTLRKRHLHARGIRIEALRECNGEWDG
jgi:APA family basic amino acid/polyamine antiporter